MIHRNLFSNAQCVSIVMAALCESQAYLSLEPAGSQHCLLLNMAAIFACASAFYLPPIVFVDFLSFCLHVSIRFCRIPSINCSLLIFYFIFLISNALYLFLSILFPFATLYSTVSCATCSTKLILKVFHYTFRPIWPPARFYNYS
jgi:hypothetical protein